MPQGPSIAEGGREGGRVGEEEVGAHSFSGREGLQLVFVCVCFVRV